MPRLININPKTLNEPKEFGILLLLFFGLISVSYAQNLSVHKPPNVILIVTDDQGYGDLSCHGNTYVKTPNIDKLYEESARFTDFHVDPTCAPSRAALLTGKYSHHVGVWHTVSGGNHLRTDEKTMAEVFKSSGYRTALFGKWHLGSNYPYRPIDRGFDEWLGQGDGGTGTTDDWFDNDRVNDYYWHNGEREKKEGFAPDVFYNEAIDFITKNKQSEKPFFIYLPTYLPHHPHTLPKKLPARNNNTEVSDYVSYFFKGIEHIDQNIGRLREVLAKSRLSENTIIVFMTDNGGTAGVKLFNAGMRGSKGDVYEGGHRVPFFIHWPKGKINQGIDIVDLTAHIDVLPTLIELCGLTLDTQIDFDGVSLKRHLYHPEIPLEERTLFVETQRTFTSEPWLQTAGMTNDWRLIDNTELYNISEDPDQSDNIIDEYPDVVKRIREGHDQYWSLVSPIDREQPRFIVGHPDDTETYLTTSDWYLPNVPWNHAQLAKGNSEIGEWNIKIHQEGTYRFEVRRWPKEANATINGIPTFNKKIDAWSASGGIEKLIYGDEIKSLPIKFIKMEIGDYSETKRVRKKDKQIIFDVKLKPGKINVRGIMLNTKKNTIAGTYYVYVTLL